MESPPRYCRAPAVSAFDAVEAGVRVLLERFPSMPATVLAERVGWTGSASWFRKRVGLLRPEYAPKDPADRLSYQPGNQAQCDLWFPPAKIPVGGDQTCSAPVLVVVASFSRCITARMVPSRTTPDLLAGIWSLLAEQLGAVPRRLVWDNEAGIGRGGRLADGVAGFSGTLATKIVQLKPFDPESKGIVERAQRPVTGASGGERLGAQHRGSTVDDGCNVQVFMGVDPAHHHTGDLAGLGIKGRDCHAGHVGPPH
jgi:hypothetical protein